jgi:acetyl-CoA carboxylase biotin carboxylase subunit
MKNINRILIANRGEIAVRIIKTACEMGIETIAVHDVSEAEAMHVKKADKAVSLGEGTLKDTYLNIDKIIQIARENEVDAIHPGYGFLSENPSFAEACQKNHIVFIGPGPEAIRLMGNKLEAANTAKKINIPLLKYPSETNKGGIPELNAGDFPIMVKASAGGGGKGMRIVRQPEELKDAMESTAREAKNYFGDDTVYIEKYLANPKHIEIQVLADHHGNAVHLFERECSIQRRHQKIIEEAPSPALSEETRKKMTEAALRIVREINYTNAGTVEFLLDSTENFYFMEMNTRIQVEHPVTEMITGVDIVREQIRIAQGLPLSFTQEEVKMNGHAIESRIYAEDVNKNFLPSPGKLQRFIQPEMTNIRIDSGILTSAEISPDYDPMIAKVSAWDEDRSSAIQRLTNGLNRMAATGIKNNLSYLRKTINHPEFLEGRHTTRFVEVYHDNIIESLNSEKKMVDDRFLIAAILFQQMNPLKKSSNIWETMGYWNNLIQKTLNLNDESKTITAKPISNSTLNIETNENNFQANLLLLTKEEIRLEINAVQTTFSYTEKADGQLELIRKGISHFISLSDYSEVIQHKKKNKEKHKTNEQIFAPMFGKVLDIKAKNGKLVKKGETLLILEAMKMENNILALEDTKIKKIFVNKGDQVKDGQVLIETVPVS